MNILDKREQNIEHFHTNKKNIRNEVNETNIKKVRNDTSEEHKNKLREEIDHYEKKAETERSKVK